MRCQPVDSTRGRCCVTHSSRIVWRRPCEMLRPRFRSTRHCARRWPNILHLSRIAGGTRRCRHCRRASSSQGSSTQASGNLLSASSASVICQVARYRQTSTRGPWSRASSRSSAGMGLIRMAWSARPPSSSCKSRRRHVQGRLRSRWSGCAGRRFRRHRAWWSSTSPSSCCGPMRFGQTAAWLCASR